MPQDSSPNPLRQLQIIALRLIVGPVLLLSSVRAGMTAPMAVQPPPAEKVRAAVILPLAILEGAAFLCAIAFLLTPTYWPLIAAAIPLGTMVGWFPRAE